MSHPSDSSDPWRGPSDQPAPPPPPPPPPPYGAPPHYGQPPPYGYGYAPPDRGTNGLAIASMVLGIVWVYWIGSVLALVFGYVARGQIRQSGQKGEGMAIAGIVLGWVGVGFLLLFILLAATAGSGFIG
jgi:hypothetical protein